MHYVEQNLMNMHFPAESEDSFDVIVTVTLTLELSRLDLYCCNYM